MPGTTRLTGTTTTRQMGRRAIALLGMAMTCAALSACVAGGPKKAPAKLALNSPGVLKFDTCARPVYPAQEFKLNQQGTVTLRFLLGANGTVKESLVAKSSGYPALDEAARVALVKCSFTPAMVDGEPRDAWTHVQYVWQTR